MDYRFNLKNLRKDFRDGKKFTLFVGAGINSGNDVHLLWNELIREACEYSFRRIGQNMLLTPAEIESMLSLLGIIPPEFEHFANKGADGKALLKAFNEYNGSKDFVAGHFPVEIQVSIIKTLLSDSYIPFLQDYLYSQCNKDRIAFFFRDYELRNLDKGKHDNMYSLYVIARMILLNPQIVSVISYNYDNFLSSAITYLLNNFDLFFTKDETDFLARRYLTLNASTPDKFDVERLRYIVPAVDIGNENIDKDHVPDHAIRIYHVHGYIPSTDELQYSRNPSIVLSSDEYFDMFKDSSSWSYTAQLNGIMTTNCLFIGSSLTDLSAKRMLNMALSQPVKTNRYVLDAYERKTPRCTKDVLREIKDCYLENLGVSVIDCDEGFHALFREITEISNVGR